MLNRVRARIEREVIGHTGLILGGLDYEHPAGDPGLFGPQAVCWRVHGDFTSMLVGGMSALLLQMLHPLALAGVWDHSSFRADMLGRLRRTGQFIAGTTFGSTADAEKLIERVRGLHAAVQGVAPDGRAYAASDPALLTWVHVAEMRSFLAAHLRYLNPKLARADQDRYYRETALVAERLGARDIPRSVDEVGRYLEAMRAQLRFDARTRAVLDALRDPPAEHAATRWFAQCALAAAFDLLPDFARGLYPPLAPAARRGGTAAVRLAAPVLRWAVTDGARHRATRRFAAAAAHSR